MLKLSTELLKAFSLGFHNIETQINQLLTSSYKILGPSSHHKANAMGMSTLIGAECWYAELQTHDPRDKVSVLAGGRHVLWKASPLLTVKVQSCVSEVTV